jgi:hypothetical protein
VREQRDGVARAQPERAERADDRAVLADQPQQPARARQPPAPLHHLQGCDARERARVRVREHRAVEPDGARAGRRAQRVGAGCLADGIADGDAPRERGRVPREVLRERAERGEGLGGAGDELRRLQAELCAGC